MKRFYNRGMALIEIVIGSAIIVTGIIALSSSYTQYLKFAFANQKNIQAAYLAEEGIEAITFLRDRGWTTNIRPLSTTTPYYLVWNGSYWTTTTTSSYVEGQFLRTIMFQDVVRDGAFKIASSGTYDQNTKKVTVTLAYVQGHATTTKVISTYITNLNSD